MAEVSSLLTSLRSTLESLTLTGTNLDRLEYPSKEQQEIAQIVRAAQKILRTLKISIGDSPQTNHLDGIWSVKLKQVLEDIGTAIKELNNYLPLPGENGKLNFFEQKNWRLARNETVLLLEKLKKHTHVLSEEIQASLSRYASSIHRYFIGLISCSERISPEITKDVEETLERAKSFLPSNMPQKDRQNGSFDSSMGSAVQHTQSSYSRQEKSQRNSAQDPGFGASISTPTSFTGAHSPLSEPEEKVAPKQKNERPRGSDQQHVDYDILFDRSLMSTTQDLCKKAVERAAGTRLSWWPLAQPEDELRHNYTRVYSQPRIGTGRARSCFYDDIPTSLAEQLFPNLAAVHHTTHYRIWKSYKGVVSSKAVILHDTTLMRVLHEAIGGLSFQMQFI